MSPTETQPSSSRRRPRAAVLVAAVAVIAAVAVALVLLLGGDDEGNGDLGVPRESSAADLRDFAEARGNPVFWAGEIPGTKIEFTETSKGHVFVRYLPELAPIGDDKPLYPTIATYPQPDAARVVRRAGRARGNVTRRVSGGGLVTWSRERPTSIYLAAPGIDFLVEVFHPRASEARELALSGRVRPASS